MSRPLLATFAGATLALGLTAGVTAPARAEVSSAELLGWCEGATSPDQLGTINAFRCVNYLQGAADVLQAVVAVDLTACLSGGQSIGAQLKARFVPALRAAHEEIHASGGQISVPAEMAAWLERECGFADPVASDTGELAQARAEAETQVAELRAALDEANETIEDQAAALVEANGTIDDRSAALDQLNMVIAGLNEDMTQERETCVGQVDELKAQLSELASSSNTNDAMVASLELELEAAEAANDALRQEMAERDARLAQLMADIAESQQALDDALDQIALQEARLEQVETLNDTLQLISTQARARIEEAELQIEAFDTLNAELEEELEASRRTIAALDADLQSSNTCVPSSTVSSGSGSGSANNGSVGNIVVPPSSPPNQSASIDPAPPADSGIAEMRFDPSTLASFRQLQQQAVERGQINVRIPWTSPDGRFSGFAVVTGEGTVGASWYRQVYAEARYQNAVVERADDRYCRQNMVWRFCG